MSKEDFTIFVGNLHEKVTEEILYELFLQAGPVDEVRIPCNNGVRKNYGFVQFKHEISVPYALYLLDGIRLFDRQLKLNSRSNCLHLFRPPPPKRIERRRSRDEDDASSLRGIGGGARKRFVDKSMLPSGPARKQQRSFRDDSPQNDQPISIRHQFKDGSPPRDQSSSLRFPGGLSAGRKRLPDISMMPTGPSRNSTQNFRYPRDDSPPGKGWSPKHYPSQFEDSHDTPKGYERGSNGVSRSKNRYDHQKHRGKPYNVPYYNEKHNNRDKSRFDSYSSQRSRHHRP